MKVEWVSQDNPTSAADALDKSIAKWRFFSYCTKEQFLLMRAWVGIKCGLCNWNAKISEVFRCKMCSFAVHSHCPNEYIEARDLADDFPDATLAQFHAAARKVAAKLRSLKKS